MQAFDVASALGLSAPTAPLKAFVAMVVMVHTGRPVTFLQPRPGKCCLPFKPSNFRGPSHSSSTPKKANRGRCNWSAHRFELRRLIACRWSSAHIPLCPRPTKAVAYDRQGSRIAERSSPIGSFLRRTRLDALPQLYNILVGDTSFADARCLLPSDQPHGDKTRPGLPEWARTNGGRNLLVNGVAALDIRQANKTSVQLDLKSWGKRRLLCSAASGPTQLPPVGVIIRQPKLRPATSS
jgi:lipopolysaccharide/colanic/teichoic acid biosynthesis glycosyltransferase